MIRVFYQLIAQEFTILKVLLAVMIVVNVGLIGSFVQAANLASVFGLGSNQQPIRLAQATVFTQKIQLEIGTSCKNGSAHFRVRNVGAEWPDGVSLALYRLLPTGDQLISKRNLRLGKGQQVSFNISAIQAARGEVGIWVDPKWYNRNFVYDSSTDCSTKF